MSFTRNSEFTRGIVSRQGIENVPGHYYYHNAGGVRYWHYFGRGLHWYGFYWGPRFFWLPFYAGYWWWWDVNFSRWVFWSDGYWWWYAPGGVVYVDVNNDYVPYDQYEQQNPSTDMPKPPSAPPTAPPSEAVANTPAKEGSVWKSSDGTRMVQIAGNNGEAILYDESSSPPTLIKTLATTNVEKVRFTGGGASGKPLQILVDYKDGSFALFDANGNRTSQ